MNTNIQFFKRLIPLLALILLCSSGRVQAMFFHYETRRVPIDRVMANLERRLAQGSNKVETLYYLARIHAESYALQPSSLTVPKDHDYAPIFEYSHSTKSFPKSIRPGTNSRNFALAQMHLTNAIALYQEAVLILHSGTNVYGQEVILPTHLGLAWCIDQSGNKVEAIKAYRLALEIAWHAEVERVPKYFGESVDIPWDQFRAKRIPKVEPSRFISLSPGSIYSDEIIGYLLKLLDPVNDMKEIAQLKKDLQVINDAPRAITPIVMPLTGDIELKDLVDSNAKVTFDLDGSGLPRKWKWITPKAGWIVYDHDGSGRITSGLQMFGSVTFWIFWRDGYDALSSLDDNGDGKLSGAELRGISVWQDINGNGVSDPGEVRPITDWGVIEIDCSRQAHETGIPFNPKGVVFRDGSTRPTYDWIVPSS